MAGMQGPSERPRDAVAASDRCPAQAGAAGSCRGLRIKKWLRRAILIIAGPAVFLSLLEGVLRLTGYGYCTRFLLAGPGEGVWTSNEKFAWRFTTASSASTPEPFVLAARKAPGAYRIFVLGESAAAGTPDPSFGFARILQVMLREQYPQTRFEVINAAMMGINSHAILPIARECAQFQPDLFIIYMGNNEACGFFGPMTVLPGQDLLSLPMIRAGLWVKSTRLGQLLGKAMGPGHEGEHQDMEGFLAHQVAADEQRYRSVADRFGGNLAAILDAARGAGAKAVVCTVAVNLKDCPPFGSQHRPGLAPAEKSRFDALCVAAAAAQEANRLEQAAAKYVAAEKIDDRHAELHFKLAMCLYSLNQFTESGRHFILARDLDTLQFRADSRLNAVVRQVASKHQRQGTELVDIERLIASEPVVAHGIVGQELLYEHVHFTFGGNFAVAKAMLPAVRAALPDSVRKAAVTPPPQWTRERCAQLLALTPLSELRMAEPIAALNAKPPFLNQFDNARRRANAARWVDDLRRRAQAADPRQSAQLYEAALARNPEDWRLHHGYADLLLMQGDVGGAAEHLRLVLKIVPHYRTTEFYLGQVLIQQGKPDQAAAHYRAMLARTGEYFATCRGLGDALAAQRQYDQAIEQYRQALKLNPGDLSSSQAIVKALLAQGKADAAVEQVKSALADQPVLMHTTLAEIWRSQGKVEQALGHFRQAIVLAPADSGVRLDFAAMLMTEGKIDLAVEQYRHVLTNDPRNVAAPDGLGAALIALGKTGEAADYFNKALEIRPDCTAYYNLGNLAVGRGDLAAAEDYYRKAVALEAGNASAQHNLGSVLLACHKTEEAIEHLRAAIVANPEHASAYHLTGQALKRQGKTAEAIRCYRRSVELKRREPELLSALAWALATAKEDALRNSTDAVAMAEEAAEKTLYKSWRMLDVLGAAYADAGRFAQAGRVAEVAAELAAAEGKSAHARDIRARGELYRSKQPYREP